MSALESFLSSLHGIGLYDSFDIEFGSGCYLPALDLISLVAGSLSLLFICLAFRWMYLRITRL